jgi:coenzyme F420-reducing hydrogenase alpha subunit
MSSVNRTIKVDYLSRVEGEGSLFVNVKRGVVSDARFQIFEPPRFFEAFLRGRHYTEAPDITARICGICPVAYQMSAVHAMEQALGVTVGGQLRALRRLLYCGEWIESHALHIFMLHLPDFLGYDDAIQMAQDHPKWVTQGLTLKKTGNAIMTVVGGREVHPINVRVGGFYRVPTRRELAALVPDIERARDIALAAVAFTGTLDFPTFSRDYEFVAMRHPDEYPFNEGRLVSNRGLDIPLSAFETHFVESHVAHSNALHATLDGRPYFVGPLARYNLNFDRLSPLAQEAALATGIGRNPTNPFQSIIVRAVETLYACDEALRLIAAYEPPSEPFVPTEPRAAQGVGCSEAPRGICYHRYTLDDSGAITSAKIVPPTSQNQLTMEADLRAFVEPRLGLSKEALTWQCEQAVRNYDPCISCATHFLTLNLTYEPG